MDIIAKMCSIAIVKVGARGSLIRKGTEEVRVEAVPVAKVLILPVPEIFCGRFPIWTDLRIFFGKVRKNRCYPVG